MANVFGKIADVATGFAGGPEAVLRKRSAQESIGERSQLAAARLESEKARRAMYENRNKLSPQQVLSTITKLEALRSKATELGDAESIQRYDYLISAFSKQQGFPSYNMPSVQEPAQPEIQNQADTPNVKEPGLFSKTAKGAGKALGSIGGALGRMNTTPFPATGFPQRPARPKPAGGALGGIMASAPTVQGGRDSQLFNTPEYMTIAPSGSSGAPGPDGSTGEDQSQSKIAEPKTQEEFAVLPSGTLFRAPDGTVRRKP